MREEFAEYYPRTEAELSSLWKEGLVALDANVLLGLYEYPPDVLDAFLNVLKALGDRLWLPHHVGVEYHKNRHKALPKPRQTLKGVQDAVAELRSKVEKLGFPEFHPTLDLVEAEERRTTAASAIESISELLEAALSKLGSATESPTSDDMVRTQLEAIFAGRIGSPLSIPDLDKAKAEADRRYARKIPPGFRDSDKDSDSKYGDYIIWKSLLAELKSRTQLSGLLFVTNDRKEDWWIRSGEALLGPRSELIRECLNETSRLVHLYTPSDFLRGASVLLAEPVSASTVAQVERITSRSPVEALLRALRMELPSVSDRISILCTVREAVLGGAIRTAGDIRSYLDTLPTIARNSYVSVPLFFALVNEAYGPIKTVGDGEMRLRERTIELRNPEGDAADFIRHAHVAWLAQALYRVRRSEFSRDEVADAFFGVDAGDEAHHLLAEAERSVASDVELRGQ
jgi:hypothetical protein